MQNLEELQGESAPKDVKQSTSTIEDLKYGEINSLITSADDLLNKISSLINKDIAYFVPLKEIRRDFASFLLVQVEARHPTARPHLQRVLQKLREARQRVLRRQFAQRDERLRDRLLRSLVVFVDQRR